MTTGKRLLSPSDVALEYGLAIGLQARWRMHGLFCRYIRVGKYVRYERADLEAWIQDNKRFSSREELPSAPTRAAPRKVSPSPKPAAAA